VHIQKLLIVSKSFIIALILAYWSFWHLRRLSNIWVYFHPLHTFYNSIHEKHTSMKNQFINSIFWLFFDFLSFFLFFYIIKVIFFNGSNCFFFFFLILQKHQHDVILTKNKKFAHTKTPTWYFLLFYLLLSLV
jgi:hypothetical protein